MSLSPEARRAVVAWMLSDEFDATDPGASVSALDARFDALVDAPMIFSDLSQVVGSLIHAAGARLPVIIANVRYAPVPTPVPEGVVTSPEACRMVVALVKSAYRDDRSAADLILDADPRDLAVAQSLADAVAGLLSDVRSVL